jgi:hypothetical protein
VVSDVELTDGQAERSQPDLCSLRPNNLKHKVGRANHHWALLTFGCHPDQLAHIWVAKAYPLPASIVSTSCPLLTGLAHSHQWPHNQYGTHRSRQPSLLTASFALPSHLFRARTPPVLPDPSQPQLSELEDILEHWGHIYSLPRAGPSLWQPKPPMTACSFCFWVHQGRYTRWAQVDLLCSTCRSQSSG